MIHTKDTISSQINIVENSLVEGFQRKVQYYLNCEGDREERGVSKVEESAC